MRKEGRRRDRGGFLIPETLCWGQVSPEAVTGREKGKEEKEGRQRRKKRGRKEKGREDGRGGSWERENASACTLRLILPQWPLPLFEVLLPLSPQVLLWGQSLLSLGFESSSS